MLLRNTTQSSHTWGSAQARSVGLSRQVSSIPGHTALETAGLTYAHSRPQVDTQTLNGRTYCPREGLLKEKESWKGGCEQEEAHLSFRSMCVTSYMFWTQKYSEDSSCLPPAT